MEQSFLYRIAERYWQEKGEGISQVCFVFPNRRAGLFFRKHIAAIAGKPIFAPQILTINQLFEELSPLRQADNIDLLFRLYEVYQTERGTAESFDKFIFWGRMMLSDFNEVDQHLVDAQALFTNLRDLKAIDAHFAALTAEQTDSVQTFLRNMQGEHTNEYKERFFSIWNSLLPIYTRFRDNLRRDGIAYTGMLQREVVAPLPSPHEGGKHVGELEGTFVFIGFNALTGVERALMEQLRDAGQADFYWDYEAEWLRDPNNRASMFYQQNTHDFPSRFVLRPSHFALRLPQITWLRVPSAVGQSEVVRKILASLSTSMDWTRIGIVLPNENMLLPVQQAIPSLVQHVNITMGQPLRQTPIYSLLLHLSELLLTSSPNAPLYHKPILALLNHPYVQTFAADEATMLQAQIVEKNWVYIPTERLADYPCLERLLLLPTALPDMVAHLREVVLTFAAAETMQDVDKEYLYQTLLILNRIERLIMQHPTIGMERKTLFAIIIQLVENQRVAFEGEPLLGLQIMGVLESRSMDFNTLIMTDVNDETLPGKPQQNTYIPYDLRLYFGLPTAERQDAIFAYNFYRLIAHAEQVYLLQNTVANDINSGEVSRYIYQLQYQYNLTLTQQDCNYTPAVPKRVLPHVDKTPEVMAQIKHLMEEVGLSPSALNTYVACPLRFYWETVLRIRDAASIQEDIEANQLGTVLHAVLETLYGKPERPYTVSEKDVERMLQKLSSTPLLETIYAETVYHTTDSTVLTPRDQLAIHAIRRYAQNILKHDKEITPFRYIASEEYMQTEIVTSTGQRVRIKGIIDRVDEVREKIRVIDYKTGAKHADTLEINQLYQPKNNSQKNDHYRQILCYAFLYTEKYTEQDCGATVYYTRNKAENIEESIFDSFRDIAGFKESLLAVCEDILDETRAFVPQVDEQNTCAYCQFTDICGVKKR